MLKTQVSPLDGLVIILQGGLHLPNLPFYGKSELSLLPKIYLRIVLPWMVW